MYNTLYNNADLLWVKLLRMESVAIDARRLYINWNYMGGAEYEDGVNTRAYNVARALRERLCLVSGSRFYVRI